MKRILCNSFNLYVRSEDFNYKILASESSFDATTHLYLTSIFEKKIIKKHSSFKTKFYFKRFPIFAKNIGKFTSNNFYLYWIIS